MWKDVNYLKKIFPNCLQDLFSILIDVLTKTKQNSIVQWSKFGTYWNKQRQTGCFKRELLKVLKTITCIANH